MCENILEELNKAVIPYGKEIGLNKFVNKLYKRMAIVIRYEKLNSNQEERYRDDVQRAILSVLRADEPVITKGFLSYILNKQAVLYAKGLRRKSSGIDRGKWVARYEPNMLRYDESVKYDEDGLTPKGFVSQKDMPYIDGRESELCGEQIKELMEIHRKLPEYEYNLLKYRVFFKLSYSAIAEMSGVVYNTARAHVFNLLDNLIDYFIEIDNRTKAELLSGAK